MTSFAEVRSRMLSELYPPEGAHGKSHAEQTERICQEIAATPYYQGKLSRRDLELLSLSALGHDSGVNGILKCPFFGHLNCPPYGE
jgi:HD superfamily phosphodiesterase